MKPFRNAIWYRWRPDFVETREGLRLTHKKARTMELEWWEWVRDYLPPFSLEGKIVLDVGAGCGETANLFFERGAKKVIAVEIGRLDCKLLRDNAKERGWNILILEAAFNLLHYQMLEFDFAKIDVEGAEKDLLKLDELRKPLVMECHYGLDEEFLRKFSNMTVKSRTMQGNQILTNCNGSQE